MSRQNLTYYLAERPAREIVPGKTFVARTEPAPTADDLKDGEALVETLYLSLDPALRGQISDRRSYTTPVAIGERMRGIAIVRVLASKTSKVKAGDIVNAPAGWTEVAIVPEHAIDVVEIPKGGKMTDLLGALAGVGLTAYIGLANIGRPKPGETVVVSSAAGATGSIAGQIAKIQEARVVGIAGTDEKCAWLRDELGFDAAVNYKSPSFRKDLKAATPGYIDVYWDNVGGAVLDAALERAAKNSRFVMCGSISGYNAVGRETVVKNLINVVVQRIHMEGFIFMDHADQVPEARRALGRWIGEGKLKSRETIIKGGLKEAEGALLKLFGGANTGKMLLEVKSVDEGRQSSVL